MRQVSKAVLKLRKYLKNTTDEELKAGWDEVKKMSLKGPTLSEYMKQFNEPEKASK